MVKFQKQKRPTWAALLLCGMRPVTAVIVFAVISSAGLFALQASIVGGNASLAANFDLSIATFVADSNPAEAVAAAPERQQSAASGLEANLPADAVPPERQKQPPPSSSAIPHRLFFPYDFSNPETKDAHELVNGNIENTISLYRAAFNDPNAPVTILNNTACRFELIAAKPSLLRPYDDETNEKIKFDVCRIAALYNHGGYAMDVEVRVVEALVLDPSIKFATIASPQGRTFMQAWLASTPGHQVMAKTLDVLLVFYEGRVTDDALAKGGKNLGRRTLKAGYDAVDPSEIGNTRFLTELNLRNSPTVYPELPRQSGKGCCCQYVAHDRAEKKVYFYTRIPGVTPYCELPKADERDKKRKLLSQAKPKKIIGAVGGNEEAKADADVTAAKRKIPHLLIFTFKTNILETREPQNLYDNVQNTIAKYRDLWGDSDTDILSLDNTECAEEIGEARKRLLPHFYNETQGKFKGDICRIAVLYNKGGYYMDVDIKVIEPVVLSDTTEFSTVRSPKDTNFFQAWLASSARHPVLCKALDIMLAYYEGTYELRGQNMGCSALKDAHNAVDESQIGEERWLRELNLDKAPTEYTHLPRQQGTGCCCNYIVHDENEHKAYFYSRIVGAGPYCDVPKQEQEVSIKAKIG